MNWAQKTILACASLLCFLPLAAHAEDVQVLPEFEEYLKLNSMMRAGFDVQGDRSGGDPVQLTVGPAMDFYLKPLIRLKRVTTFDLDDSKSRFLVAEINYRSITGDNTAFQNRMTVETTSHFPLKGSFLVSERNRADLTWKSGVMTWRYRNKVEVDKTVAIRGYHLIPYVSGEPYYLSQYSKWSTTALTAGCFFPVGGHVQFETYYEHDNNTGKKPNAQVNDIGIVLHLYFSLETAPVK